MTGRGQTGSVFTMRLYADCLGSKFGFNDGDEPEALLDWCDEHGLPYPEDWHAVLIRLVRAHLLPLLPGVEVQTISTAHNPIRAVDPAVVQDSDVEVEVTWQDILAASDDASPQRGES